MGRRLIAGFAVLIVLGSIAAIPISASRPCCCKKAAACPMHQKHGVRLDRCTGDSNEAMVNPPTIHAVLVAVALPQPQERNVTFAAAGHAAETRDVAPPNPPPRLV